MLGLERVAEPENSTKSMYWGREGKGKEKEVSHFTPKVKPFVY
jgi:hypothetical protein